jgi:hypothetical protein
MQMRSRGAVAAITAALVVVCGVLAMRHEATTLHVRDRGGGYVHAPALVGHHTDRGSDIHSQRSSDTEAGDCAVLTAFHQAACAACAPPIVVAATHTLHVRVAARVATPTVATVVYRLAPKTSPPVLV